MSGLQAKLISLDTQRPNRALPEAKPSTGPNDVQAEPTDPGTSALTIHGDQITVNGERLDKLLGSGTPRCQAGQYNPSFHLVNIRGAW